MYCNYSRVARAAQKWSAQSRGGASLVGSSGNTMNDVIISRPGMSRGIHMINTQLKKNSWHDDLHHRRCFSTGQQASKLPPPKAIPQDDGNLKQLAWRAKQRGWLELDWLIGNYADSHLANLNESQLKQFEVILELDNPDLYNWLSGIEPVPDHLKENEVLEFIMIYTNEDHPNLMKARRSN